MEFLAIEDRRSQNVLTNRLAAYSCSSDIEKTKRHSETL